MTWSAGMATLEDIYENGARACFPEMTAPPQVLMAAIRVLACIDRGDVDLLVKGTSCALIFHGEEIAEIDQPVPEVPPRITFLGPPFGGNVDAISRSPVRRSIIDPLRMTIENILRVQS